MAFLSQDIVIVEGARTPIGKFLGGLSTVSATELGVAAAKGALDRSQIDPADVDGVFFGNVIQSSKDAAYIARHVGLKAGVPKEVPALTVNRACASGIDAVVCAAKALLLGESRIALAGGAENMSMTPYAMRGVRTGWRMIKSDVDDMLFSALFDPMAECSIGETVEYLAQQEGIDRAAADRVAVESQKRARAAQEKGVYAEEIVPVEVRTSRRSSTIVEHDENLRPETNAEVLSGLPGLFAPDGVVSAGNSSGLNDAGAAVVVTTQKEADARGLSVLGRLSSWGIVGTAPRCMGLGPVEASRQALDRAGLTLSDVDVIELNDSFAAQQVAVQRALELPDDKVNVNGGALALGHPMAATGTRLLLSALYELRRRGGGRALCTVCVGGGQGIAAVVERT